MHGFVQPHLTEYRHLDIAFREDHFSILSQKISLKFELWGLTPMNQHFKNQLTQKGSHSTFVKKLEWRRLPSEWAFHSPGSQSRCLYGALNES